MMMTSRKGISTLIAAVVLIAVTLAMAGFLSVWALQTVQKQTGQISYRADCIGAVQLAGLNYNSGTGNVSFTIWNTRSSITLAGVNALVSFSDGSLAPYELKNYGLATSLNTTPVSVTIDVGTVRTPTKLTIIIAACGDYKPEFEIL
ncbi:MAG: archaellin/type IV pilin N-terminal domain-containing protein [Candidatus Aenigmatarchaeota archaeon]